MQADKVGLTHPASAEALLSFYRTTRAATAELAAPLSDADASAQSMPDASPAKWHLAHTSWFFEAMVLRPFAAGYQPFDDRFDFLFNSYYDTLGARHPRPNRGLLTRPSLDAVTAYRNHVDRAMETLLNRDDVAGLLEIVELGCHHEQQHQELLLTDILHLFAQNPLLPAYRSDLPLLTADGERTKLRFVEFDGGLVEIGHDGAGFAFDSETPRHKCFLEPFKLASRPVINAEWVQFIADGGYSNPLLWLSEGWATVQREGWQAPLYWRKVEHGTFRAMTLQGDQPIDLAAPVTHISYYEADAFARWAGRRLPTEAELEAATEGRPIIGNFTNAGYLRPIGAQPGVEGLQQLYGDVWEWTQSPFTPYPRFRPAEGAVGEYNGKFMASQFVLRGGSCATPNGHMRATYRNFFPPSARWQFSGVRLADDV